MEFQTIGKRTPYVGGEDLVTGRAIYADDLRLPGMLIGRILRSPLPHARILKVDVSKARRVPGVVAVITGQDVATRYGILPVGQDETALAVDRVRYVGEGVAAVAAESIEAAEEALERIEVVYEPLPAYFDALEAMQAPPPWIHDDRPNNILREYHHHFGDVERGFAEADYVREHYFFCPRLNHAAMEPHSAVAQYDLQGRLTVWSSTQTPYYLHRTLAKVLGLPMDRIRIIKPAVGGGFGGKDEPLPHEVVAAKLAMVAGRPVRVTMTREEVFYLNRGRPDQHIWLKVGVKRDGRITAVECKVVQDGGAYCSYGVVTILYAGQLLAAIYDIPHIRYDGYRVLTNKPPCGAQRGHGSVNTRFAFESLLDMIAEDLGLDPVTIRARNFLRPNTRTVNDLRVTSYGLPECIRRVVEASHFFEKWRKLPYGRGIGLGCSHYVSGAGRPIIRSNMPHSNVIVRVDVDGGINLYTGTAEIGQGCDTVQAMIVAEVLGVPLRRVRVVSGDSDLTPLDLGSYSSRVTFMAGNAALQAARQIRDRLAEVVSRALAVPPERLEFRDERVFDREAPDRWVSFDEAVYMALQETGGTLVGKGAYSPPPEAQGGTYKGAGVGPSPAYSYSASVAEVSVDVETGEVRVERVWTAHDCGRALNPLAVEGQIEGSVSMGLGQALMEQVIMQDGRILNAGLLEYKTPGLLDHPVIESIIVESIDPEGPFGAKEVGEGSLAGVIPAIANAVYDAVGVRIDRLPITPERVLEALRKVKAGVRPSEPVEAAVRSASDPNGVTE